MKGWSFRTVKLSANGSTTIQTLNDEKKRLESRLIQIPVLILNLEKSIATMESDNNWLKNLNDRRRKNWEQENNLKVVDAIANYEKQIVDSKANLSALKTELASTPDKIKDVNRQIEALVKGESTGLTKGLDAASAQQLGELALQKEQNQIAFETQIQKAEIQKLEEQKNTSGMTSGLKTGLIIGSILLTIAIIGFIVYKKKLASQVLTTRI
jgi:chromosome segregation ATPase